MLKINVNKMDFGGKNTIISRVVNLDTKLELVVLISVKDTSFGELFLNKILDVTIDKIHTQNAYNDFSSALENVNSFLHTWRLENEKLKGVHAVIAIIEKSTLLFSTLGSPSCYLINSHQDVIEVTDKEEQRKDFGFISNGDISQKETIIFGTTRLLHYLSKGDMSDSARLDDILDCNDNIHSILKSEKVSKNIGVISLRVENTIPESSESKLSRILYTGTQLLDNNITKRTYALFKKGKRKLLEQSKTTKNITFTAGMLVCFIFLYIILSSFIGTSTLNHNTQISKDNLLKAREFVRLASENINNPDTFSLYIQDGENLVQEIQDKQLFLNDVAKIQDDISLLKKQFNGIETFIADENNTIYSIPEGQTPVKVLSVGGKVFIVNTTGITGPIISGQETVYHNFDNIASEDTFIDATVQGTNIVLLTKNGKVVNFAKNNFFSYLDVQNQPTWEESNIISSYASNVYMLGKLRNQVFRHKKISNVYGEGVGYLSEEDTQSIGVILSMAIDGGIYLLKNDLSLVKLFVSPKYRLETITLNKLPKNYSRESSASKTVIYTANNLNYFYMLLDDRVLIFQPNTNRYQDVKSMQYVGQVEARDFDIISFYVANDGEIFLLGETGLYKMGFEISEDKLIIR